MVTAGRIRVLVQKVLLDRRECLGGGVKSRRTTTIRDTDEAN